MCRVGLGEMDVDDVRCSGRGNSFSWRSRFNSRIWGKNATNTVHGEKDVGVEYIVSQK